MHVVFADQVGGDVERFVFALKPEPGAVGAEFNVGEIPVRRGVLPEGEDVPRGNFPRQPPAVFVVDVDHRGAVDRHQTGEKELFRLIIVLHISMIIEVLAG